MPTVDEGREGGITKVTVLGFAVPPKAKELSTIIFFVFAYSKYFKP